MAPGTEGTALAPTSAAERSSAATWALPKPCAAWKKTTCLPLAKPAGKPAAQEGDALLPAFAAMMVIEAYPPTQNKYNGERRHLK